MPASTTALLFGLSQTQALVVLFVILPFALAAIVVPLVAWRSSKHPQPVRTSDILAHGVPGKAEIISVRPLGSIVDLRPMVRFQLKVTAPQGTGPFDLEVVQSLPRAALKAFRSGDVVPVRLTPDLAHGAVVWHDLPTA